MEEQAEANRRLEEALTRTGARDPRPDYRDLLRTLKGRSEEEYAQAVALWEQEVIGPTARGEAEPLARWLEFGTTLADRLHPGRTVTVDRSGRAHPQEGSPSWEELVLHLPEEHGTKAIPVVVPPDLSSAQEATIALLVEGRVKPPGS
ncbi:MAG: hypothetical protein WD960_15330 [Gemmatimonadota bacterium]